MFYIETTPLHIFKHFNPYSPVAVKFINRVMYLVACVTEHITIMERWIPARDVPIDIPLEFSINISPIVSQLHTLNRFLKLGEQYQYGNGVYRDAILPNGDRVRLQLHEPMNYNQDYLDYMFSLEYTARGQNFSPVLMDAYIFMTLVKVFDDIVAYEQIRDGRKRLMSVGFAAEGNNLSIRTFLHTMTGVCDVHLIIKSQEE